MRIILGSTPKLGAGTNIQDRLIALHHLDAPWKPSDLEQQEGRILRQGNRNEKVWIYRYVTENSFDAYLWQILENKQKFISQIMTSKSPVRACEDVDDTALSYAEVKALATGNPYIREKMDLDVQVSKLKVLKADYLSQKYRMETNIARTYPIEIAALKEEIACMQSDAEALKQIFEKKKDEDSFCMTIGRTTYIDRKKAGRAIIAACVGLEKVKTEWQIGEFYEFTLFASFMSFSKKYELRIKRKGSYRINIGKDPLGNIQRISNVLEGIEKQLDSLKQQLETVQQQFEAVQVEVEKPFAKENELAEKLERLAELNALLDIDNGNASENPDIVEESQEPEKLPGRNVTLAGMESENIADEEVKPSVLGKLKEAKERVAEAYGKNVSLQKRKEPEV